MSTLDERIAKLRLTYSRREALLKDVKLRNVREKSINEQDAVYHPYGHYLFFCIHDKHNFSACATCGRTQADGDIARDSFLRKYSVK